MNNNRQQVREFVRGINWAMEKLERLAQAMDDHLEVAPDDVTWSDVGTINKINDDLQDIVDFTFGEGEHAE